MHRYRGSCQRNSKCFANLNEVMSGSPAKGKTKIKQNFLRLLLPHTNTVHISLRWIKAGKPPSCGDGASLLGVPCSSLHTWAAGWQEFATSGCFWTVFSLPAHGVIQLGN